MKISKSKFYDSPESSYLEEFKDSIRSFYKKKYDTNIEWKENI